MNEHESTKGRKTEKQDKIDGLRIRIFIFSNKISCQIFKQLKDSIKAIVYEDWSKKWFFYFTRHCKDSIVQTCRKYFKILSYVNYLKGEILKIIKPTRTLLQYAFCGWRERWKCKVKCENANCWDGVSVWK